MTPWEPSEREIEEKLIAMAYVWGDIEEEIEQAAIHEPTADTEWIWLSDMVDRPFRVEAAFRENGWGDPCTFYDLLYDVADPRSREGAAQMTTVPLKLAELIRDRAQPWHTRDFFTARLVPRTTPVEGQICRRLGEKHPARVTPSLTDVPTFTPSAGSVELVRKGPYSLTPIEAPFYDALSETGLTFSVQPWIQTADEKYRVDFLVFYGGSAVAVELDGHEWHKTREQRSADAARERALMRRGITVIRFTGSQVFGDVDGCIRELRDVLRQSEARP